MKSIPLVALCLALSGCAGFDPSKFDNIVSCAKGDKTALYSSMYGPLGVTSKVRALDADAICAK